MNNNLIDFAKEVQKTINSIIEESSLVINAKVYDTSSDVNICLCELNFVDKENFTDYIAIENNSSEFKRISQEFNVGKLELNDIKLMLLEKIFYYCNEDKIYIIRENKKEFWNKEQGVYVGQNIAIDLFFQENNMQ
jgi:hypothetical protein